MMNQDLIRAYVEQLNWHNPEWMQEQMMNTLVGIPSEYYHMLLQQGEKACWENEARVIVKIGYPKVKSILPGIFAWFQDLNWPGVNELVEMLKGIDKDVIVYHLKESLFEADQIDDELWYENLEIIAEILGIH